MATGNGKYREVWSLFRDVRADRHTDIHAHRQTDRRTYAHSDHNTSRPSPIGMRVKYCHQSVCML